MSYSLMAKELFIRNLETRQRPSRWTSSNKRLKFAYLTRMCRLCSLRKTAASVPIFVLFFVCYEIIFTTSIKTGKPQNEEDLDASDALALNTDPNRDSLPKSSFLDNSQLMQDYATALERSASDDHWVLLIMADASYLDMIINLYLSSLQPLNIENYLFLSIDGKTCGVLQKQQIKCFTYTVDRISNTSHAATYDSKDFLQKMLLRNYMVLDALLLGYNVLHSDVDVYFFKSPFRHFKCDFPDCDIATLWDISIPNAGFVFVRNSQTGRSIYMQIIEATKNFTENDQAAMNTILQTQRQGKILKLSEKSFQNGQIYWTFGRREFGWGKPCPECVVVHNNWIVTMEAKRYRFRESNMWVYDGNGYYSDPTRRYLSYDNPSGSDRSSKAEIRALKNAVAIAQVLNRTLILPKFSCGKYQNISCCLMQKNYVALFEHNFPKYREHMFLQHHLVPSSVKVSLSPIYIIAHNRENDEEDQVKDSTETVVLTPREPQKGATSQEVFDWFHQSQYSVLRLRSLSHAFSKFTDENVQQEFERRIKAGFHRGNYRQLFIEEYLH